MSQIINNEVAVTEPMMIQVSQVSQSQVEGVQSNQQNSLPTGIDPNIGNQSIQQRQLGGNSNEQNISEIATSSMKDQEEDKKDQRDNPFEKERYLDVKDYLGDWKVGIVQNIIEKQMKVHIQFDGCSSKLDDFIPVNSNRFTHFRRYTKGYTGEKNSAIRFRRNIDDIQRVYLEMEKHEFKGVTALQYNQHARGKYFFGVDQALQNISYEGNAAFQVLELILNHIKYAIRYILKFPSLFNDYQRGCSGNDSQFNDLGVAISFGYFEVFQLLLIIFGTSDRLVTNQNCFYAKNWRLIRAEKDKFMNEENDQQFVEIISTSLLENDQNSEMNLEDPYIGRTPKELLREKILQEITPIFINCFWQQGGYTAILQLFNSTVSKLIPLEALFQILKVISITLSKSNFNRESMRNHGVALIESSQIYTSERLKQLTEKEVREYDGNLLRRIREKLQEIVKYHHDNAVVDTLLRNIDVMELNVALKLLTSQYLNRKIQGLNDISEVIAEIKHNQNIYNNQAYKNNNYIHSQQGYSDYNNYDQLNDRKINPKEFTEWIITNKIIDHLLGDSLHVEIIRRCHEILKFMCAYKQFPLGLIDTIWNSCGADTHEAIVSAIFDMIIQISDQLSRSALQRVHQKINSIPLTEVNEQTLHLLRGFSQKAIQRLVPIGEDNNNHDSDLEYENSNDDEENEIINGKEDGNDREQLQDEKLDYNRYWTYPRDDKIQNNFFCLGYLWRIIQESQLTDSIPTVIAEGALSIVRDIFGMSQGYKVVRKYAGLCLDQLSIGKSSYQTYFILCGVFDNHYGSDLLTELLESKTNLPHMIVNEIYNYISTAYKNPLRNCNKLDLTSTNNSSAISQSLSIGENIKTNLSTSLAAASLKSPISSAALTAIPSNQSQHLEQVNISSGKFSHEANIHVRLALLETVLCKTEIDGNRIFALSPDDFDMLWKAFISQPNYPSESELFINWIYRKIITKQTTQAVYYGQQTDISHLFTIDLMRYIFLNVFCENTAFDFVKLSNELFAIFLYLFKKINLKAKAIELIPGTQKYKVIKEELLGQDTMWKIFRLAEDKQVISNCCDQLSEMYLNHEVSWENSESSEKYLRLITNLCMELLQEGFEKQESSLIDRSVALLNLFFLKFEGEPIERMYKQLLERQYSQYSMQVVTFTFILASDNSKKEIKFNSNTPFGLIRRRVAQEFKLPVSSFRLFCKATKSFVETYEDEESRQLSQNSYILHMVQGADLENAFHPKNFIIQNNQYFDLLFSVLSVNFCSEECHNNLWELILKLPQNEHIKQSILKVEEPWNEIFKGSFHKKLYCLNILHDILTSNSPQFPQWFQKFLSSNGYQYLHEMVADLDVSMIQNALSKKYVRQLLKVITLFFNYLQNKGQLEDTEEDIQLQEKCFERIIQCINRVCEYAIEREQKDLENSAQEKEAYIAAQNHHYRALQAAQSNNNNNNNQQQQNQSEPKPPEFFSVEKDMIHSALYIINNNHLDRLLAFFTHPLMESILWKGLSQMDNMLAKQFLCQTMEYLFNFCTEKSSVLKYLLPVILDKILPQMVSKSVSLDNNEKIEVQFKGDRSALFFRFACHIISKSNESVEYDFEESTIRLAQMEMDRPVVEMSQSDKDEILIGIMSILKQQLVLSKSGELSNLLQNRFSYVTHLLDSTFQLPVKVASSNNNTTHPSKSNIIALRGPKFKAAETRKQSFDLLTTLSANNLSNLKIIMEYIHPLILSGDWRTNNSKHWEIVPKKNEKSSTGYVGLKNLGCICYMNSLLQQLFMIPSFREDILKCKDIRFDQNQPEDNILLQLKCMFTSLCYSEKEAYNPKKFCHAFKDYEGNPTNVFEQMDIDEFFNALMDKLETQMKGTPHAEAIKQHFGGVLSNEIISKGCSHSSESEEAFLSLSLQVKNKKDIKQSLEALVQGEMLEGDNAYHCEKCNKKVNALKRTCLKKLPNHLILVLKRFEFNYDSMQKVKINQFCSFPEEIDFSEFSQQGLRKMQSNEDKQLQQSKQSSNQQQQQQSQSQQQLPEQKDEYPESYFKYRLNGIVIHMGIADSGHYYSYIRERNGNSNSEPKWMEFNDNIVKPFDPKEIPNEAFGGEEKWKKHMNMMKNTYMMNALRQKIRNAYLLFYERIDPQETNPDLTSIPPKISDQNSCSHETKVQNPSQNSPSEGQDHKLEKQEQQNSINHGNKDNRGSELNNNEFEEEQEDLEIISKTKNKLIQKHQHHDLSSSEDEDYFHLATHQQSHNQKEHQSQKLSRKYCRAFRREIFEKNGSLQMHRIIFSDEFASFMAGIMVKLEGTEHERKEQSHNSNSNIVLNGTNILVGDGNNSKAIHRQIRGDILSLNLKASKWLLNAFTDCRLIEEIIMSPFAQARQCTIDLLESIVKIIFEQEKDNLFDILPENNLPKTQIGSFLNCLLNCLSRGNLKFHQFFDLLLNLASFNDKLALYMLNRGVICRIVDVISGEVYKKKMYKIQVNNKDNSTSNVNYNNSQKTNGLINGSEILDSNNDGGQNEDESSPFKINNTLLNIGLPYNESDKYQNNGNLPKNNKNINKNKGYTSNSYSDISNTFYSLERLLEYFLLRCSLPTDSQDSPAIKSSFSYRLSQNEHECLNNQGAISCLYYQASREKSTLQLANKIVSYLASDNKELSVLLQEYIFSMLHDKLAQEYYVPFSILHSLFANKESYLFSQMEELAGQLIQSILFNLKYPDERDVSLQYLIRLASDYPVFAEILHRKHIADLTSFISITQNYQPAKKDIEKNALDSQKLRLLMYGIKIPLGMRETVILKNVNLHCLDKIKQGIPIFGDQYVLDDISNPFNSTPEKEFLQGGLLDYFDEHLISWRTLRIQQVDKKSRIISCYEIDKHLKDIYRTFEEEKAFYESQNNLQQRQLDFHSSFIAPFNTLSQTPTDIFKKLQKLEESEQHLEGEIEHEIQSEQNNNNNNNNNMNGENVDSPTEQLEQDEGGSISGIGNQDEERHDSEEEEENSEEDEDEEEQSSECCQQESTHDLDNLDIEHTSSQNQDQDIEN